MASNNRVRNNGGNGGQQSSSVTSVAPAVQVVQLPAPNAPYVSAATTALAGGNAAKCIVCGKFITANTSIIRGVGGTCIALVQNHLPSGTVLANPTTGQTVATNAQVATAVSGAQAWLSPLRVVQGTIPVTTVAQYGIPVGVPYVTVKMVHWAMHAAKVPTSLMVRAFGGDKARNVPFTGTKATWAPVYVGRSRYLHPSCNTAAAWGELQQASAQGLLLK
jgi:hypothetical protein